MNKRPEKLNEWATIKNIVVLSCIFILFQAVVWPIIGAKFENQSKSMRLLDLKFSYSPEEAYETISAYGVAGKRLYTTVHLPADLIYAIIVALLLGLSSTYVFSRAFVGRGLIQKFAFFPIVPMIMDFLENIGVIILLSYYPKKLIYVAQVTSLLTSIKWISIGAALVMIVVGLTVWIVRKVRFG